MSESTYSQLVEAVREKLTEKSARHSEAVAQQAARVAQVYGVDVDDARVAGLLHDWSRDESGSDMLAAARIAGDELTEVDVDVPYLLHAKIGARAVHETFPDVPDRVIDAISRHTVGGGEMTPLDKTVYVADMTEPGRTFPGVDQLREMIGVATLDEVYAEAYATSLRHLVDRRKRLHPATVAAWNIIVSQDQR